MSLLRRLATRDQRFTARHAEAVAPSPPLDRPHDACLLHLGSQFDEPGERKWLARRAMSTISLANSSRAATTPPGRRCNSVPTPPFHYNSTDLVLKRGDTDKFLLRKFLDDLLAEESHRLKRLMEASGWPGQAEQRKRSKRPSQL